MDRPLPPSLELLHGDAWFFPKNGLSAFLMSELHARGRFSSVRFLFDGDVIHHAASIREGWTASGETPGGAAPVAVSPGVALRESIRWHLGRPLGRRRVLCHTLSMEPAVSRCLRWMGGATLRLIVEHGTVEMFRYIQACRQGETDHRRVFLLSFHEEVMRLLGRRRIAATMPALPFPYHSPARDARDAGPASRTLFAMQGLVDWGVLSEPDCRRVVDGFLDRRSPMTYLIKQHPRGGGRTLELLTRALDARGLPHEILPDAGAPIETHFPRWGCQEISTFYSTSAWLCRRIHGVPCDTALAELADRAEIRLPEQRELIDLLRELFDDPAARRPARRSAPLSPP